jgi:hypothetical protein
VPEGRTSEKGMKVLETKDSNPRRFGDLPIVRW